MERAAGSGREAVMSGAKSDPPRFAIWLLRHACRMAYSDELTGDLIERFHEGRTSGWFYRQVLNALAEGVLCELQRHWPLLLYAVTGAAMPPILWKTMADAAGRPLAWWLQWWTLPWPWSQLLFDLTPSALLALTALPALASALAITKAFRWLSLLRTGVITLALVAFQFYLFALLGPWLTRPVTSDPYHRVSIIPGAIQFLLSFATFLLSAWLGCRPDRRRRSVASSP
jgi:hypothetical protein